MRSILLALLALLVAQPARADEPDPEVARGKAMGLAAVDLAKSGNYAEAAALFEKAYGLTREAMLLYNLGRVYDRMGDLPKAKAYLERFVSEETDPEKAERGRKALAEVLARWPGRLRVTCALEGAQIEVDGEVEGHTPMRLPLELPPGKHALKVTAKGKVPFEREIEIAPDQPLVLAATLDDDPAHLAVTVQPPTARLLLDGKPVDPATWADVKLSPGAHFVRVDAEGYEAEDHTIDLAPGDRRALNLTLKAKPKPVVAKPTPPAALPGATTAANDLSAKAAPPERKGLATWQWALIGTGAAAVVAGGIVAGVLLANSGGGERAYDGEIQITKPLEAR